MADRRELADGRLLAVREVRVAVPELLGEVELEPLGEDRAPLRSCAIEGEALEHLLGRAQVALAVPAALRLAALERRAAADRDEDVLQQRPPRMVRMDVSGRDRLHAEVLGEVAQKRRAGACPRARTGAGARRRSARGRTRRRDAPRHSDREGRDRAARSPRGRRAPRSISATVSSGTEGGSGSRSSRPRPTRSRMRGREQAAEVRVPAPRLHEQRDVSTAVERDLRSRDRPHAERLRGVRELEGAVDAVVVGEGERLVAELRRARRELLRLRRSVEERVRRVRVELHVAGHD